MSSLTVSNIYFESTGNNRIQFDGSNSYSFIAGGVNVLNVSPTEIRDTTGNLKTNTLESYDVRVTTANDAGKIIQTVGGVTINGAAHTVGDVLTILTTSPTFGFINILQGSGTTVRLAGNVTAGTNGANTVRLFGNSICKFVMVSPNTFVGLPYGGLLY
jgi:hypothetical protein